MNKLFLNLFKSQLLKNTYSMRYLSYLQPNKISVATANKLSKKTINPFREMFKDVPIMDCSEWKDIMFS